MLASVSACGNKAAKQFGNDETPQPSDGREKTGLTCPLDIVHAFFNEERDGAVGGHQGLQGDAKVVAIPGSPGGRVQRFGGLGRLLKRE